MSWQRSGQGATGQGNTRAIRKVAAQVKERDNYQCQLRYPGCTRTATEADHTVNIEQLGLTRAQAAQPHLMQAVCHDCHTIKTQRESADGQPSTYADTIRSIPAPRRPRGKPAHPGD